MTDVLPAFRHVLLTRFNTRRPAEIAPDERWLGNRWPLFERFCVPSVTNQHCRNFDWLIFFDAGTSTTWRERIEASADIAGFSPVFLDEPFTAGAASRAISAMRLDDAPFLITSRLDNDDALAPQFIAAVQAAFRPRPLEFLNLPWGYQLADNRIFLRPYLASSFASLVEKGDTGAPRTVHFTEHHLIGRHPVRQVWSPPAWLQVVHGANLANEVRGIPIGGRAAASRFGLCDVEVAWPSPAELTMALIRLVGRGVTTPEARDRALSLLPSRRVS